MIAELHVWLDLYQPNVGDGNYSADVSARGANEMLRKVIVRLGVASVDDVDREFRRLDAESRARKDAAVARAQERAA